MTATKVIIGLTNPKSPTNVGGVMRASGCYQVDEVRYTGKRYDLALRNMTQYNTDTHNAKETIAKVCVTDLLDELEDDIAVVCVDLVVGAIPLPQFEHPAKAIYIFGPEDGTISQAVIDRADSVVYVPTVGCMNLAASVNVLLYDRLAKSSLTVASDDLIKQSRDTNNRVRVKPAR